jgi:hypothetical protein
MDAGGAGTCGPANQPAMPTRQSSGVEQMQGEFRPTGVSLSVLPLEAAWAEVR